MWMGLSMEDTIASRTTAFIDTEAFVTLDDDDDRFDEIIPMIDIPSEGEEDEVENESMLSSHAVDLVARN
ncbi:hypothetical protein PInf_009841 [Phytophthora infestans]|nr:hypothetical protein PInf_009841 [Phytophthora infestans]